MLAIKYHFVEYLDICIIIKALVVILVFISSKFVFNCAYNFFPLLRLGLVLAVLSAQGGLIDYF